MHHLDGQAWALTGKTGTMAAALAQDSLVFAIGAVANDGNRPNRLPRAPLEIESLRLTFTAVVASATPAAAGRVLQLFKASDNAQAMPTGGSALTALPKRTLDGGGDSGMIGDVARIATTTGLTAGTFTRGTVPLLTFDLSSAGAAAGRATLDYFEHLDGGPLWLDPGEIFVLSNPAAFDLLLTWELSVNVGYRRRDNL